LGNVSGLLNLIVFVFLLTFLAAIFAVQLFRGELPQVDFYGAEIEVTFFTIYNSFLGMYQILSSENWTQIVYYVTSYGYSFHSAWVGAIFFVMWFTLANCEFIITYYFQRLRPVCVLTLYSSHRPKHVHCCHSRKFRYH